jgi:predicted nucleic acid-binding protein
LIAYIDSSVLLRVILGQADQLSEWKEVSRAVMSTLVEVECLRTLDRLRLKEGIAPEVMAARREAVYQVLEEATLVEITRPVLSRASQPLPAPLGTLDAIHLATALIWAESRDAVMVMATHDASLGLAARASGLRVIGT